MSSETIRNAPLNSIETIETDQTRAAESTQNSGAYDLIPLELIDEPERAIRSTFDQAQLAELAMSIDQMGLVQPIVVERTGERFRVIAGHRRLIACQIAKLSPVPCLVREQGVIDPAAVKLAENYYREAVNPAEEARFLEELLNTRCGGDTDVLAALIKHPRAYVEDRILLLRGDPEVVGALSERLISLAVARELNKVTDSDMRLVYLDAAKRGGATAAIVRGWRQLQGTPVYDLPDGGVINQAAATDAAAAPPHEMRCMFCGESDEPERIEHVWLHKHCRKYLDKILDRGAAAGSPQEGKTSA